MVVSKSGAGLSCGRLRLGGLVLRTDSERPHAAGEALTAGVAAAAGAAGAAAGASARVAAAATPPTNSRAKPQSRANRSLIFSLLSCESPAAMNLRSGRWAEKLLYTLSKCSAIPQGRYPPEPGAACAPTQPSWRAS